MDNNKGLQQADNNRQIEKSELPQNPFENHRTAEEDINNASEQVENEQQFKEAQTERD